MNRLPAPEFIQLYPTFRCTQTCSFCFNRFAPHACEDMTPRAAERLLSTLLRQDTREIDIMGGEPLLLDWLPDFVRNAVSHGFAVNISTNGSLPQKIRSFNDCAGRGLRIGVSLEGSTAERHEAMTGSRFFDAAISTIETLAQCGFDPVVKTVLDPETLADIPALTGLLASLGVRRYFLLHMDMMDPGCASGSAWGYPEFRAMVARIRESSPLSDIGIVAASCFDPVNLEGKRCAGGNRKLAVMPDGSAYPCNLLIRFPQMRLGNILEDDFDSIWDSPALAYFRRPPDTACEEKGCPLSGRCTGGCPAHNLLHTGRPDGKDIRCRTGYRPQVSGKMSRCP